MLGVQEIAGMTFVLGILIAALGFGGTVTLHLGKLAIVGSFGAVMALLSLMVLLGLSLL